MFFGLLRHNGICFADSATLVVDLVQSLICDFRPKLLQLQVFALCVCFSASFDVHGILGSSCATREDGAFCQQPANSQGNERCRVRLGFDRFAQPRIRDVAVSRAVSAAWPYKSWALPRTSLATPSAWVFVSPVTRPTPSCIFPPRLRAVPSSRFSSMEISFPKEPRTPGEGSDGCGSASVEPVAAARSFGYWTVRALLPALPDTHSEHKTRCRNENASSHRGRARRPVVRTCGDKTSPYRAPNAWLSAPDSLHRCGVLTGSSWLLPDRW